MSMTESKSRKRKRSNAKTAIACCSKDGMRKGPWTPEEDELLSNYINREGEGRWRTLPKMAGLLRCGKSCRLRWMNYLRPSVKRGHIAEDEEDLILRLHRLLGNRWSLIAGRIPGRTDNEIKNYWNTHLSKKLISQGIDPRTHKPLDPNNTSIVEYHQHNASSSKPNDFRLIPNPNLATSSCSREDTPMIIDAESDLICNDQLVNLHEFDDTANELDNDDIFSSFLNSLINEDLFDGQIEEPTNADIACGAGSDNPMIISLMPALHQHENESKY